MKYIVILGDGMSDHPLEVLGGKTPLEAAKTPMLDELAGKGELGMVQNVPEGMVPGSDVANLSVLGYDPRACYTGRAPLEALSLGVCMEQGDVVMRCNLVTVTEQEPYAEKTMLDYSSGGIGTQDADILLKALDKELGSAAFSFFTGTGYRHLCRWSHGQLLRLHPPHDHLHERIGGYLPEDRALRDMMERSFQLLNSHPINLEREAKGLNKANSIWFWGAGTKPRLQSFRGKTGKIGAMISAVDLLKGIAVGTGMKVVPVTGADGTLQTNYEGKAQAAVEALLHGGCDLVYVHLEAPDEMSHQGRVQDKIKAIENLDSRLVTPIKVQMDHTGQPYRMLILPDHATPVALGTHTAEPVPYILYDSTMERRAAARYTESEALDAGNYEPRGDRLLGRLLVQNMGK